MVPIQFQFCPGASANHAEFLVVAQTITTNFSCFNFGPSNFVAHQWFFSFSFWWKWMQLVLDSMLVEKGYTLPQIMPDCWQFAWQFAYILPLVLNLALSPLALSSFVKHATEAFMKVFMELCSFTLQIVLIHRHKDPLMYKIIGVK